MRSLLLALAFLGCDAGEPPPPVEPIVPVAVAVVLQNDEIFMGNATYETNEDARYHGFHGILVRVWDRVAPSTVLPAGSRGTLIMFADKAAIQVPMGPIERLDARAFGEEIDYRGRAGSDVASGVELAVQELNRVNAARRVLVVITGKIDIGSESSGLDAFVPAITYLGIEPHVITNYVCGGPSTTRLGPIKKTGSADALASELNGVWKRRDLMAKSGR